MRAILLTLVCVPLPPSPLLHHSQFVWVCVLFESCKKNDVAQLYHFVCRYIGLSIDGDKDDADDDDGGGSDGGSGNTFPISHFEPHFAFGCSAIITQPRARLWKLEGCTVIHLATYN